MFVFPVSAHAIFPPDEIVDHSALFGQDHAYTVTFRGNGEAIVNMRIAFTNSTQNDQSTVTYRVPRVNPQDMMAYQVVREPDCLQYDERSNTTKYSPDVVYDIYNPAPCIKYQEPNYYDTYWYGTASYLKAKLDMQADTITITLPKGVPPNKTGSILLYYRTYGYTKKGLFGSYNYLFESLKSEEPIRNLQIGITTDSQLKLKNPDSEVTYRSKGDIISAQSMMGEHKEMVGNSSAFDTYYQQIGQGRVIKYATYLQPLESFTVKGVYADALWKLYAQTLLVGTAIAIVVFTGLAFGMMKFTSIQQHTLGRTIVVMGIIGFVASVFIASYSVAIYMISMLVDNCITQK